VLSKQTQAVVALEVFGTRSGIQATHGFRLRPRCRSLQRTRSRSHCGALLSGQPTPSGRERRDFRLCEPRRAGWTITSKPSDD
jgi:hypothetical protein